MHSVRERTHITENSLFFCDLNKINVSLFSPLIGAYFQHQSNCFRTINILLIRQTWFIRKIRQKRKVREKTDFISIVETLGLAAVSFFYTTKFLRTAEPSLLSSHLLFSIV